MGAVDLSWLDQLPEDQKAQILRLAQEQLERNRLADYRPYAKQLEFHRAGADLSVRERLLKAGNQLGKALKHGTRVLTPGGWVSIESIQAGQTVIAGDGTPTKVLAVYPQGEVDLFRVTFDQGEAVECCAAHQWTVLHPAARFPERWSHGKIEANPRFGRWEVFTTAQMLEVSGSMPRPRRRFLAPHSGTWQFDEMPVPIDPYVLGLLIGDGCLRNSVSLTTADDEIAQAFTAEAQRHDLVAVRKGKFEVKASLPGGSAARATSSTGTNPMMEKLRDLGLWGCLSHQKFVPSLYLLNAPSIRLSVLQGLMDTDGSISSSGAVEFCTTSPALAEAVEFLVHSFGGKCRSTWRTTHFTHKGEKKQGRPSCRIRIRLPHVPVFRLKRKADRIVRPVSTTDHRVIWSIEPSGRGLATCIRVEHKDATFVIEHGIVTHNSLAGSMEAAMHLTGRYPDWWTGATFPHATTGWAASETSQGTRDTVQRLLLGPIGTWGTGAIPADAILEIKRAAHGVPDAVDTILVRHVTGKVSRVTLKTYDQGRERWQGDTLDWVWFDEEPPLDIYSEGLTRTNATQGIVWVTFTPLLGMSDVVKRFLVDKVPGTHVTNMTIHDAEHYTPEQRKAIIASYPAHEREARASGTPMMGSGRVFPVPEERIVIDPFPIPAFWPQIGGLDFGWDHPTAAARLAIDRDTDTIYLIADYRQSEATPLIHTGSLKPWGEWLPWAWPHDGLQHDKGGGEQLKEQYKAHGLRMLKAKATHPAEPGKEEGTGGNSVEAGITEMLERMLTGRWKVFRTCGAWLDEFRLYHRKDGKIVKEADDVISASRYAYMMRRFAAVNTKKSGPIFADYGFTDPGLGL